MAKLSIDKPPVDMFGHVRTDVDGRGALNQRFGVTPFSVLDARQGNWQNRKREWIKLGIKGEEGRQDAEGAQVLDLGEKWSRGAKSEFYGKTPDAVPGGGGLNSAMWLAGGYHNEEGQAKGTAGTSIFDPVLCELMYKWFNKPGGSILDPFAGESTKGIIAAYLGYDYVGVELRQEQVDANNRQAEAVAKRVLETEGEVMKLPTWICGDSSQLASVLDANDPFTDGYDFIWTSPPYYDLEIYSKSEKDGSAFETYEIFMAWYRSIFAQAVERLRHNRFLAVKVGEVRRDVGLHNFYQFERDNMDVFEELGMYHYNRIVLVTCVGSLPVRTGRPFPKYRKVGNTHQMIYVYWKGDDDHAAIPAALGEVDKGDFTDETVG